MSNGLKTPAKEDVRALSCLRTAGSDIRAAPQSPSKPVHAADAARLALPWPTPLPLTEASHRARSLYCGAAPVLSPPVPSARVPALPPSCWTDWGDASPYPSMTDAGTRKRSRTSGRRQSRPGHGEPHSLCTGSMITVGGPAGPEHSMSNEFRIGPGTHACLCPATSRNCVLWFPFQSNDRRTSHHSALRNCRTVALASRGHRHPPPGLTPPHRTAPHRTAPHHTPPHRTSPHPTGDLAPV